MSLFSIVWLSGCVAFLAFVVFKAFRQWENNETVVEIVSRANTITDRSEAKAYFEKKFGAHRSNKRGEELTNFEVWYQHWLLAKELPACVDCEQGDMEPGPEAGVNINVRCSNKLCGSKFNVTLGPVTIHRISDRSPNSITMVEFGPHR